MLRRYSRSLGAVDRSKKLALLSEQIDEANDGYPDDFNLWKQRTDVVLRNVLGDAHPLYKSFSDVHYSPSIFSTATPDSYFDERRASGVKQVVSILEAAKLEVDLAGGAPEAQGSDAAGEGVFIVHGRDEHYKHEAARFLAKLTSNEPVILSEQVNAGRTLIEKFENYAREATFAIVIATGDDIGGLKSDGNTNPRARQNVVFELGFFFGALGRSRVALLYEEGVERPSDTDGLVHIMLDPAGAWKLALTRELSSAGVAVDWSALK